MSELDMDAAKNQLNDLQERVRLGHDIEDSEYRIVIANLQLTRKAGEVKQATKKVTDKAASKARGADLLSTLVKKS